MTERLCINCRYMKLLEGLQATKQINGRFFQHLPVEITGEAVNLLAHCTHPELVPRYSPVTGLRSLSLCWMQRQAHCGQEGLWFEPKESS